MSILVGDHIVQRLVAWGVKRIYGYPGDGINGIMGALNRAQQDVKFVQVRHEEMAAFMACAHAKFTGEVGVCLATSGPGAIHLLNGLYDAKMDHQPVVAIVGQQALASLGGDYQQEVDLTTLFKDVAHEFIQMASDPTQIRHLIDRAMRIALAYRTVTCVVVPNDLQLEKAVETPPQKHSTIHSSLAYSEPRIVPTDADLAKAAAILNAAKKPAILVGAGAKRATSEVMQVAELLGAGVAKALLGKAVLPDDLPYVTGAIGLLGTKPSDEMMKHCDALLMIGSGFPYPEFLPAEGQARAIQIDIDARMLGIRYPMELNLVGDSAETLRALIPLLRRADDRAWRAGIEENVRDWWKLLAANAMHEAAPINPQRVLWELSPRLPDDCIVSADSGSSACWFARDLRIRAGMMASLSGNLATMGPGVPYAIAAKFAFPERVAIAVVGDGAMQMNGMSELITAAKYYREWADPRLIVIVLNNHDLNMVTWEQRAMVGDAKFAASQDVPDVRYAEFALSLGLGGRRIEQPDGIAPAIEAALASDRPFVLDVVTDPEVPMLPPHITFEQARHFMSALARDPGRWAMIKHSIKELAEEVLPHRR